MKITVVGTGYVGLSLAVLLAQRHRVVALDVDAERVRLVSDLRSPLADPDIEALLATGTLDLTATLDATEAFADAAYIVIATPTDYDEQTNHFNTSTVEEVLAEALAVAPDAGIVIKSTVPVGFTDRMRTRHPGATIIFSPEFLREGRALHDNLHPSRIVVGSDTPQGHAFARMLAEAAVAPDVPVLVTGSTEAEAIKLFANTYLALRVAYFNELDTYAAAHGLDARTMIDGVCLDPRIGDHYNNPSFGYGGYCLPKDTRQLEANYQDVPQVLISAVVEANTIRQAVVARDILATGARTVGIHRLIMKAGSDNFRVSSVLGVMRHLLGAGVELLIHEPGLEVREFEGAEVVADLADFKARSVLIVANRLVPELDDVTAKVYTRDLYGRD